MRGLAALDKFIGTDPAELKKNSPVQNVHKLNVPVLLLHGEKDERAPITHARALCEAMRAQKKRCEELYIANEKHGFFDLKNRIAAYQRALEFIEKYTAAKAE